MTNEMQNIIKKMIYWNIIYVVLNTIPIIGLIGFVVFAPNTEKFAAVMGQGTFIVVFCLCFAMLVFPFSYTPIVQYEKNMFKFELNGLVSNAFVDYMNKKNPYLGLSSNENSFNNVKKIERNGLAAMSRYVGANGFFSGNHKNLSYEGAYVHTFFKVGGSELVHVLEGESNYERRKINTHYYNYFSGVITEINNINFKYDPIVIYDKKYKKKNFFYQFDDNAKVQTGNNEFDSKYIVMSANPVKAKEYLTEDIINAILETGKVNRPHGFHFIGKTLSMAVQTKDLSFKFSVFKKYNLENELKNIEKYIHAYNKLLDII